MTYLDAVAPIAHAYDGYLVHSGFGIGAPLSQSPQANVASPAPTRLRTDLDVPVLVFETETDLAAGFASGAAAGHAPSPHVGSRGHRALRLLRARRGLQRPG